MGKGSGFRVRILPVRSEHSGTHALPMNRPVVGASRRDFRGARRNVRGTKPVTIHAANRARTAQRAVPTSEEASVLPITNGGERVIFRA